MSDKPTINCTTCGAASKTSRTKKEMIRLPKGWKRDAASSPVCGKCWNARYVLRAVTIPVAEPLDATKDEMWDALRKCWKASTTAANLCVQALIRADVMRTPDMAKLSPMPKVYLYGEVPPSASGMDSGSYVALLHSVEAKYRESRYGLIWERNERPPLYRYPVPYPLRPDNWRAAIDPAGGHPLIDCRFGGRWWKLRLRGGWQFKRLLAAHKKIAEGVAIPVEASLYQAGDPPRVMAKLVAWLPREPQPKRTNEMQVTTGGDAFCVAVIGQRDPWRLNADQVRRWIAEHETYRQRMAEDLKYEKRWPKQTRERMVASQDVRCRRQNARLKNFIGQATRMLANYATRNGVAHVAWNDTDRSYMPSFPWFQFRTTLAYKLDELGIALSVTTCESQGDASRSGGRSRNTEMESAV